MARQPKTPKDNTEKRLANEERKLQKRIQDQAKKEEDLRRKEERIQQNLLMKEAKKARTGGPIPLAGRYLSGLY